MNEPNGSWSFLRDTALVAQHEFAEALRTRRLIVMLLLFVGGGALGAWGFTRFVGALETRSAAVLGTHSAERPGHTLDVLRNAPLYRSMIKAAAGSEEKAAYLVKLPPVVLFYGWVALMFLPWLVLFSSSDTISSEVASRAIRYSALRTSRLAYAVGKATGQAVIIAGVTVLCALTFFVVAWATLARFAIGETAIGLLSFAPRVFLHALPFMGIALFASMATASANMGRAIALAGTVALSIIAGFSGADSPLRHRGSFGASIADLLRYLTPFGRSGGFMYPYDAEFAVGVSVSLALAALYFAAGYMILRRRDI